MKIHVLFRFFKKKVRGTELYRYLEPVSLRDREMPNKVDEKSLCWRNAGLWKQQKAVISKIRSRIFKMHVTRKRKPTQRARKR